MKNFIKLVFVAMMIAAAPARAADDGIMKVAVIDVQRILNDAKAAQDVETQLEAKRATYLEELKSHERTLKATEETLKAEREKLTPEEFKKKQVEFEGKILETRKLAQQHRQTLDTAANSALMDLRKEIVMIVNEMSEKNGYDLVLTRQNVILAEKSMDITDDVMKALDKKISKMKLKI